MINSGCKKSKLLPTCIVIVLSITMIGLGIWQLKRAEYKKAILTQQKNLQQKQPTDYSSIKESDLQKYLPIIASGEFDNQHQFLLDNKTWNGKVGYDVITPLLNNDHQAVLLVNRGWVPRERTREQLPELALVEGTQQIVGLLDQPGNPLQLNQKIEAQLNWPRIIQRIDISQIEKQLGYAVFPYIIQLQKPTDYTFQLHWQAVYGQPTRHIAYAIQWFAFTAILIIGYFIVIRRTP